MSTSENNNDVKKHSKNNEENNCWLGVFFYPPHIIAKNLKRPASPLFVRHNNFFNYETLDNQENFNTKQQ